MVLIKFTDTEDSDVTVIAVVENQPTQEQLNTLDDCIANAYDNSNLDGFYNIIMYALNRTFGEENYKMPDLIEVNV